ncbi:MAG TPA: TatD family hydrolase, partial [Bryobacteraceae bacterium]|nr:TatD family hydrolase [Bryobacteraceae bacterium]
MTLVDSHCHLDDGQFNADRDAVVERALAAGVATILTIGTGDGPPDLEAALRQAEKHPQVLATVGIHPQYVANAAPEHLKVLEGLLRHRKCVALGEIGL